MKRSPLIILFITIFIDLLGFGLILPSLPVYVQHYGGRPWIGGALMASYSIMQFIFSPIWGRASDRYGRRPLILISLLGSAVSFYFFGAATSLVVLFSARTCAGILTAASLPTAQAYIADSTPPEKRAGGMALIGAAFGLGFAFGPVLGGVLSQHPVFGITPIAMPAYFAALLSVANFGWALVMLPETHHDRAKTQHTPKGMRDIIPDILTALRNSSVGAPLTVYAFATFAFTAVESSFSWLVILRFKDTIHERAMTAWFTYTHHSFASLPAETRAVMPSGTDWITYSHLPFLRIAPVIQKQLIEQAAIAVTSNIFAIVGITILLTQVAVMLGLARRFGEGRLVMAGSLILAFTLLGVAFVPSHALLALQVLTACIAVGNGILSPSLSSLITQAAAPTDRGLISGAQQSLGSMARIIAPPINNALVDIWTGIPFLFSSALMCVAFFLSVRLGSIKRLRTANVDQYPTNPNLSED